jgi:hypothetical protein
MTYNTLERITRQAACKTLGVKSENFDKWLITCNYNEDIEIDDFDLGTSVELSFEPHISPFIYFSSDVVFFVNLHGADGLGDIQVFFGNSCSDVEAAEVAAKDFLSRDPSDSWYIGAYFEEDCGLHMIREFTFDPESESDIESKIASCFSELLENETADKLRSFIHYFED